MNLQADYRIQENNIVVIVGKITSGFSMSHKVFGEAFYMVDVSVERQSGVVDFIPVMVSERLMDISKNYIDEWVQVIGQFRSYNEKNENGSRLILSVFAKEIEVVENELEAALNTNSITMDGYVCKEPVYRRTPLGREITEIILAVNRHYGKSDYIPCICWSRNAKYAKSLNVGEHIKMTGRIQSRDYIKKHSDGTNELKTVKEVSVSSIGVME